MESKGPRILDLRRLWPLVWMVLAVLAALLAVDTGLRLLAGPASVRLATELRVSARKRARMQEAVWSARQRLAEKRTRAAPGATTVLIIGSSSAKFGLDETTLEDSGQKTCTALNLSGNGLGFQELAYLARTMHRAGLQADLLLIAIHPVFLVEAQGSAAAPAHTGPAGLPFFLRDRWAIINLAGLQAALENQMMELRFWIAHLFELPVSALEAPSESDQPGLDYTPSGSRADSRIMKEILEHWERLGAFDADRYADMEQARAEFQTLLRGAHALAPRTLVVLMPEMSGFRERVPGSAATILARSVSASDPAASVLDLRNALPDQDCFDWMHVNALGRVELSRLVASRLALD
jgi:hypothetical protein